MSMRHNRDGNTVGPSRYSRAMRWGAVAAGIGVLAMTQSMVAKAGFAPADRIDLRVLVVDDGSAWMAGMAAELKTEGVVYTDVNLASATRPAITAGFLSSGTEAFYQAVILPNDLGGYAPLNLSSAEMTALAAYEVAFGVRQADMFTYPAAANGMATATYADPGTVAGVVATVTAAGKAGAFSYLNGPIPFDVGSYTYVAPALSTQPVAGATFTPLVTKTVPGTGVVGSIVGDYNHAGRDELVVTAAMNGFQFQFRALAHGIVDWATHGVHFGYQRNYFTFHFDDAFNYDSQWNAANKCTPGEDCPTALNLPVTDIRMVPADVTFAARWERLNNFTITLPFNGFYADPVADPLTRALVANKNSFLWLNHGLEHIFQGCQQNFTVIPWTCVTSAGVTQYVSQAAIYAEIANNIAEGKALGLPFNASEYLSGEHSGMYILPQQPADNPNFALALAQAGITSIGADASREPVQRKVGTALTVPRHPTALYYNASTNADEVSEYNNIYSSVANGGSGNCTANPLTTTCITPLNPATGFLSTIVPTDAANDLSFILNNDPRPFYAHVTNLTGDRLAYPLMQAILTKYRATFAASTPVTTLTLTQAATVLAQQGSWSSNAAVPAAQGYIQNGQVHLTSTNRTPVPITVPVGTLQGFAAFGALYGGERSAWTAIPASGIALQLPAGSYYRP